MPSRLNSEITARLKESGLRPAGGLASLDGFTTRSTPDWPGLAVGQTVVRPKAAEPLAARPKVLVADEDALCRQVLARVLGAEYNVAMACDAEEALAKVRSETPQLVVLSATLPGCPGPETSGALYGDAGRRSAPLVLMLGSADSADERADALERGVADYLEKPFGMREFAARVRVLLRPGPQFQ